ncbi:hypothetical protein M0805_007977 [Coniferiporia weirii]|nr:hypothetical protein M0805_007977 [Coniferiporia weirii]
MFVRKPFSLQRPLQLWRRCASSFLDLPPQDAWKSEFPQQNLSTRVFLRNQEVSDRIANAFLKNEEENPSGEGKVVIEAFPGPGTLTRSLLKLPPSKIKKLIVLEEVPEYLKYLQSLEEHDPRLVVVPLSGFDWSTYREIEARGLLEDVVMKKWTDERPNLHFVSHIPNSILGDQLTAQFWRLIPERSWLFKYGRVPMSLIVNDMIYRRAVAMPKTKMYCKMSVVAEAVSRIEEAIPAEDLFPSADYFHPTAPPPGEKKTGAHITSGPFAAINIYPTPNPIIERGLLDKWDYILRRLFVLKSTPLRRAIGSLAPGATNLLPVLTDSKLPEEQRVDVKKQVRELTLKEWLSIVKAFDEWPFAPEDLAITDNIYKDVEKGKR